jgi:large subunit ribosomal protein L6
MSRIGLKVIELPEGVSITEEAGLLKVKGPKGELSVKLPAGISYENKDGKVSLSRANEEKQTKQNHGTTRANLNNAVIGVSKGFKKNLEIVGIGYRAAMRGKNLVLNIGYSHEVVIEPDEGVVITVLDPLKVQVDGIDAQKVGQTAARIREVRRPEPYKGKGIHYVGEHILRKEGKRAASGKK